MNDALDRWVQRCSLLALLAVAAALLAAGLALYAPGASAAGAGEPAAASLPAGRR